jgi:hypothetical protein
MRDVATAKFHHRRMWVTVHNVDHPLTLPGQVLFSKENPPRDHISERGSSLYICLEGQRRE